MTKAWTDWQQLLTAQSACNKVFSRLKFQLFNYASLLRNMSQSNYNINFYDPWLIDACDASLAKGTYSLSTFPTLRAYSFFSGWSLDICAQ